MPFFKRISALTGWQSHQFPRGTRLQRSRPRVESLEDRALLHATPSLMPSAALMKALDHVATGTTLTVSRLTVADVNQASHHPQVHHAQVHHASTTHKASGTQTHHSNPTMIAQYHLADGLTASVFATNAKKKQVVVGPPGPQGPQGPTGPQGATGATGATGSAGAHGATGTQGPAGTSGTVIPFDLPADAQSAPISVTANTPVFIIATSTTSNDYGVGSITAVESPLGYMFWSGENSPGANPTPTTTGGYGPGFSGYAAGTHMLAFDYSGLVTLNLYTGGEFVISNNSSEPATGSIWILPAPA